MRNSDRRQASKSRSLPRLNCANAIFRLVGDLVRIVAAARRAKSASGARRRAGRIERRQDVLDPVGAEQTVDGRRGVTCMGPPAAGSANAASSASTGTAPHNPSSNSGNRADATRWVAMPQGGRIGRIDPFAGERAPGAGLARQPRQKPGRADIREKSDPDLRHGEAEAVAGDPVRAMDREPDAAAHHDPVDDRDIGLAIALDRWR